MCWAFSIVSTKSIPAHPYTITYHQGILMVLTSALIYAAEGKDNFNMLEEAITLLLAGIPSALAVMMHISAVKMTRKTGILFIFNLSTVALGYAVSIFYYHEAQNPLCTIGVVAIVAGVLYAVYHRN